MNPDWFYEEHTDGYGVKWKIKDVLYTEQTKFQELAVVNTAEWGRTLILDGNLQTTEKDEYIYHEMMVHPVMMSHPHAEKVLIIGGGDGGVLKELMKYKQIRQADMVEIDESVVKASEAYFPHLSSGFADPRAKVYFQDGIEYVRNCEKKYDLVIIDSSDPIGPAVGLYTEAFYQDVFNILEDDGMMVAQSESPVFYKSYFQFIYGNINKVFPKTYAYLAAIPTYVSGPWAFTAGSKKYNPAEINSDSKPLAGLQYYNKDIHFAAFCLPQYVRNLLQAEKD